MKRKEAEKSVDRHIRIWDTMLTEQIDKIMEYPQYKSFSKVINDALFIALPIILKRLEGKEEVMLSYEEPVPYKSNPRVKTTDDEMNAIIIKLLRETVMNVVINKSILSSLFHAQEQTNKVLGTDSEELFTNGLMSDTPDYLVDFENDFLKKLRR